MGSEAFKLFSWDLHLEPTHDSQKAKNPWLDLFIFLTNLRSITLVPPVGVELDRLQALWLFRFLGTKLVGLSI